MLNTSNLGDQSRAVERDQLLRREEALSRWRAPMRADETAEPERPADLPKVSNGGGFV